MVARDYVCIMLEKICLYRTGVVREVNEDVKIVERWVRAKIYSSLEKAITSFADGLAGMFSIGGWSIPKCM
jgi:hypothetical protein